MPENVTANTSHALTFSSAPQSSLRWRALRRFCWLQFRGFLLTLLAISFVLLSYIILMPPSIFSTVLIGLGGVMLVMSLVLVLRYVISERNSQRRLGGEIQEFRVSEAGLEIESKLGSGKFHWYVVSRVKRYPDMWLLLLEGPSHVMIPRAEMPTEVEQLLEKTTTAAVEGGRCPNCGYAIRGLTVDRCPECGSQISAFSRRLASTSLPDEPEPEHGLAVTIATDGPEMSAAIRECNLRVWYRVCLIIVLATIAFWIVNRLWLGADPRLPLAVGIFFIVLASFSLAMATRKVLKLLEKRREKLNTGRLHIRVSEEGFHLRSEQGTDQRTWSALKRVDALRTAIVLKPWSGHSIAIPRSLLPEEILQAFLTCGQSLNSPPAKPT